MKGRRSRGRRRLEGGTSGFVLCSAPARTHASLVRLAPPLGHAPPAPSDTPSPRSPPEPPQSCPRRMGAPGLAPSLLLLMLGKRPLPRRRPPCPSRVPLPRQLPPRMLFVATPTGWRPRFQASDLGRGHKRTPQNRRPRGRPPLLNFLPWVRDPAPVLILGFGLSRCSHLLIVQIWLGVRASSASI